MFFNKKEFKLKITGRAGLLYQEGKRLMKIDSEMLVGPTYDIIVYTDSIRQWEPPFQKDRLDENEKNRILQNVRSDLEKNGYKVDMSGNGL